MTNKTAKMLVIVGIIGAILSLVGFALEQNIVIGIGGIVLNGIVIGRSLLALKRNKKCDDVSEKTDEETK